MATLSPVQLESRVTVYEQHYRHSFDDFLADLGGYLGLFLGFSFFTLGDGWVDMVKSRKRKRKVKKGEIEAAREKQSPRLDSQEAA